MKVKYTGKLDLVALDKKKVYEVLEIKHGMFKIMTELEETYYFPPEAFEIVKEDDS